MKTISLLFLMIICAGLLYGTSYAEPPRPASQQLSYGKTVSDLQLAKQDAPADDGKHQMRGKAFSEERNDRRVHDKSHSRKRTSTTKATSQTHTTDNRAQQGLDNAGHSNEKQAIRNNASRYTTSSRAPGSDRSGQPDIVPLDGTSFKDVRNLGSNPAIISGTTISNSRNTAAISGTRMNRKH
jgi:hypothetical protein